MKKFYLLSFAMCLSLISVQLMAQEVLTGGDMESADPWTVTQNVTDAGAYATATFGYTDNIPLAGSGGALHVTCSNTAGNNGTNVTIWQKVDLIAGHAYVVDGAFKDIGGLNNYWLQVFVNPADVVTGQDYLAEDSASIQINTWKTCSGSYANIDVTFQTFQCESGAKSDTVVVGADGSYTFAIKMGLWNSVVPSTYDVVLDNISLMDIGIPSHVPAYQSVTLHILPNPVTDHINVSSESMLKEINVVDILGQQVINVKDVGSRTYSVNMSGVKPGMYYVVVKDANGNTGTRKITKF